MALVKQILNNNYCYCTIISIANMYAEKCECGQEDISHTVDSTPHVVIPTLNSLPSPMATSVLSLD